MTRSNIVKDAEIVFGLVGGLLAVLAALQVGPGLVRVLLVLALAVGLAAIPIRALRSPPQARPAWASPVLLMFLSAVPLVAVLLAFLVSRTSNWILDKPPRQTRVPPGDLSISLSRTGDTPSLMLSFTSAATPVVVEDIVLLEHYALGTVSETNIAIQGCGGSEVAVLILSEFSLVPADHDGHVFTMTQSLQSDLGDRVSSVVGRLDHLVDCSDTLKLGMRPDLPIAAGAPSQMVVLLGDQLVFDREYRFASGGPASGPQRIHAPYTFVFDDNEHYKRYGVHLLAVAAHLSDETCLSAVLDLKSSPPRRLVTKLPFGQRTLGEWACSAEFPSEPQAIDEQGSS